MSAINKFARRLELHILPDPTAMLAVFVVLIATVYLMNVLVFRPLIGFMDRRDSEISDSIRSVGNSNSEMDLIEEEIAQTISGAMRQADLFIQEQVRLANEDSKNSIEKVRAENKARFDSFVSSLSSSRESFKRQLLLNLSDFEQLLEQKIKSLP